MHEIILSCALKHCFKTENMEKNKRTIYLFFSSSFERRCTKQNTNANILMHVQWIIKYIYVYIQFNWLYAESRMQRELVIFVWVLSNIKCKWNAGTQCFTFYIFHLSSPVVKKAHALASKRQRFICSVGDARQFTHNKHTLRRFWWNN